VLIYNEPFSHQQLIGFALIWSALIIFGVGNLLQQRMLNR